ncbi:MAG: hypothetical protein ACK5X3_18255 [Pseudomonadota bacterium]|jgi:predicted transcriptional regulator
MKSPTRIRTYEVLAVWDAVPAVELRQAEIAAQLGVPAVRISGHLDFLKRVGKIERVSRGVYRRTAFGGRAA